MNSQVATGSQPDCLVPDHSAVSGRCHKREPASWNKSSKPPGLHWAGTLEMLGEPIGTAPGPVLQFPSHLLSQPRCPPVWVTTADLSAKLLCNYLFHLQYLSTFLLPIRSSPPQQGGKVQRLGARLRSRPQLCYLLVKGSLTGHITALSLLTGVRWYQSHHHVKEGQLVMIYVKQYTGDAHNKVKK